MRPKTEDCEWGELRRKTSAFSLRNNQTDSEASKVFARCRKTILLIKPLPKMGEEKHIHVLQRFQAIHSG